VDVRFPVVGSPGAETRRSATEQLHPAGEPIAEGEAAAMESLKRLADATKSLSQ
jgi:hypothetical protein